MKAVWDESLSVGVAEIDDQHKQIFKNYNEFSVACRDGHGADKLNDLLWFLSSYVATHFAHEERLMQRINYPGYANHCLMHTEFIGEIDKLMHRFSKEGPSEELVSTVNKIVKNWLMNHIDLMDRSIGKFVRQQNMI